MNGMTRRERQVTDLNEIKKILDRAKVVHVGMIDGDEPYVVPMNYGYVCDGEKLSVYLHCANRGRKLDIIRENPKVFFEMDCDIVPFEGEVACKYGIAYSSVMGRGLAHIVTDVEEKKTAMSLLMKAQTEKDFSFDDKMVSIVTVVKIDVLGYTAKQRPMPKKNIAE